MWRLANQNDDEIVTILCRELNTEDPGPHPIPDSHMRNTLAILRMEKVRGRCIVLEIKSEIVGYALLVSFWSNELGGEICNIDEIFIRSPFRGQGFFSHLVKSILNEKYLWPNCPKAIELEVTPNNHNARDLYLHLGFKPVKNMQYRYSIK